MATVSLESKDERVRKLIARCLANNDAMKKVEMTYIPRDCMLSAIASELALAPRQQMWVCIPLDKVRSVKFDLRPGREAK
jgi:hypothetical protein